MALDLILVAILLALGSGLPALLLPRRSAWGQGIATLLVVLSAVAGLAGAFMSLFVPASASFVFPWPVLGDSLVGIDPLGAFFLVPIFLVGALSSIYGLGYFPQAKNPRKARGLQLFFGLMMGGMGLLVIARHALAFLLGWETMALSAFFLIAAEDEKAECRRSSLVYLVATHLGTLTLFGMFALWRWMTGSFELSPFAGSLADGSAAAGAMSLVFALALLGFGIKAGMMPFHFWLPGAHAASPSHVSAMLSGVVLKMGIYGILRMLVLMPALDAAWGGVVLALGAVSGVFGVAFAIAQHDMKRLLAYHSVENIGIILMGLGVAMLGRSFGRPELAVLGLAGCLLHVWNHSLFKSLLFFGAGSVVKATGTRQIDKLGGLGKAMPWTALFFIVGAVAICGLPPLNGFVSELMVYLGLFGGLLSGASASGAATGLVLAALAVPCLAMVGALAVACFVKVCGAAFLGNPRSLEAERAREAPVSMLIPMAVLALACAFIGLAPSVLSPVLDAAIASSGFGSMGALADGGVAGIAAPSIASLAPLGYIGWISASILVLAFIAFLAGYRRKARRVLTWDCGYAEPTCRMQYTASSFARSVVQMFGLILKPRGEGGRIKGQFPASTHRESEVDDAVLDRALVPTFHRAERFARYFNRFQQGLTQQYVLYILVALVLLLLTLIPYARMAGL
jgi:hydrogenase-4 component B